MQTKKTYYCSGLDVTFALDDSNELIGWVYGYEVGSDVDFESFGNTLYYCEPDKEAEIDKIIAEQGYNMFETYDVENTPWLIQAAYVAKEDYYGELEPLAMTLSVIDKDI